MTPYANLRAGHGPGPEPPIVYRNRGYALGLWRGALGTDPTGLGVAVDLVVVWGSNEQLLAMAPLVEEAPEVLAAQLIALWIR